MSGEAQAFWDERYRERGRAPLHEAHPYGRAALASAVPGRALELGCGLGAMAIWLASHGWTVTAVDVSRVALDAAAEHAERAGVSSRITWQHGDLREWTTQETFDLVAALFLHTPLELDAPALLARAATQTRAGGTLLSVGHYTLPPSNPHSTDGLLSAREVAVALGVQEPEWRVVVAEELPRTQTGHDGRDTTVLDAVLHALRLPGRLA